MLQRFDWPLEKVAPAVFFAVVRDGFASVAPGRDGGFDFGFRQFRADGIGVMALVGALRLDLVGDPAEQRADALDIVGLPRCRDKAERVALGVAPRREWC